MAGTREAAGDGGAVQAIEIATAFPPVGRRRA